MHSLKGQEIQKKTIFKPLLTNPYVKKNVWPKIAPEIQNDLLQALETNLLYSIKQWNLLTAEEKKKLPIENEDHLNVLTGFNSIMSALEKQIQDILKKKTDNNRITMLFVCKQDISCKLLYAHLPTLCALANVKLITLPKGSSKKLSSALGISKLVQFLAIRKKLSDSDVFISSTVNSLVENIKIGCLEHIKNPELDMNVKFVLTQMPIVTKKQKDNSNKSKKN